MLSWDSRQNKNVPRKTVPISGLNFWDSGTVLKNVIYHVPHTQPIEKKRYGTLGETWDSRKHKVSGAGAMSHLVLHMDKFKKEAIRGIQSHNRRERRATATPDKAFFDGLTPEETRRFFEESKAFLTEFCGRGECHFRNGSHG